MSRSAEGKFQDTFLEVARAQGCSCQKFNDLFSEGIPDTLVMFPETVPMPNGPFLLGMWVELKAVKVWPKRMTSHLPAKAKPSGGQIRWLKAFDRYQMPCLVLIGTPGGWLCIPQDKIEWLWSLTITEIVPMLNKEKPTVGRILRVIYG
jgi:hypothetical protein